MVVRVGIFMRVSDKKKTYIRVALSYIILLSGSICEKKLRRQLSAAVTVVNVVIMS